MLRRITTQVCFRGLSHRMDRGTTMCLSKQCPEVFAFLHPLWRNEYKNATIPVKTMLFWKCPNGPDHEWKSSARWVIDRYQSSKMHSKYGRNGWTIDPCPFCSSQFTSETNSLLYRYPYIADEWDDEANAEEVGSVTYGTTCFYQWSCSFHPDHPYQQSPNRRTDLNIRNFFSVSFPSVSSLRRLSLSNR